MNHAGLFFDFVDKAVEMFPEVSSLSEAQIEAVLAEMEARRSMGNRKTTTRGNPESLGAIETLSD